jgi:CubicO group peptidase (beta-lactamase class C family)
MNQAIIEPEQVGMSARRLERIEPVMQGYVDKKGFAGISTLVARRGAIVHAGQVGWMDREAQKPMRPDTIFRIYSMTKPIICTALMTLYEEGRFQLIDPVSKYIPAFGKLKVLEKSATGEEQLVELVSPVTIQQLLTHTAGLTYDFLEDSPVGELCRQCGIIHNAGRSLQAMVEELARLPLAYQPGSRWHYSLAIDVVGHLIEMLSGQPLDQFLQTSLFTPLGMEETTFCLPEAKHHRLAAMYGLPDIAAPNMTLSKLNAAWEQGFNERLDVSTTYPTTPAECIRGGHGLFSTIGDYLRFAQMLLNGGELDGIRILGRKTVELMHSNHLPARLLPYELGGIPSLGYGFGLGSRVLMDVAASGVLGSVGEFGWAGAAKTYYWVDPKEELVGILMSQSMMSFDLPDMALRVLAYQALVD